MPNMKVPVWLLICGHLLAVAPARSQGGDTQGSHDAIAELTSDDRVGNAVAALAELGAMGSTNLRALEVALTSADYQQRQLAAHVLRGTSGYAPNDLLLAVTVEGLQHDVLPLETWPTGEFAYTGVRNAAEGTRYLAQHVQQARPFLHTGLESPDEQQRTLCALVLAISGSREAVVRYEPYFHAALNSPSAQQRLLGAYIMGVLNINTDLRRCADILLEHLKDNQFPLDAAMSIQALSHLGTGVLPYLSEAETSADMQQRKAIAVVRSRLRDRPLSKSALKSSLHCIWFPADPANR